MNQISNSLSTTAMVFDAHVHGFKEAVSLVEAETVVDSSKWAASQLNPNFFFQIQYMLFTTVTLCSNPLIRRRALVLLRQLLRREGKGSKLQSTRNLY